MLRAITIFDNALYIDLSDFSELEDLAQDGECDNCGKITKGGDQSSAGHQRLSRRDSLL